MHTKQVDKSESKRHTGRPRHGRDDGIEVNIKLVAWEEGVN
jgi:hypothetical protein